MLYRKYEKRLEDFLVTQKHKILLVNGARQIGKSFIIRYVGKRLFSNFIEINLKDDQEGEKNFAKIQGVKDFYLQLSAIAGNKLGTWDNTLVFLDEIQAYPKMLTLLKFLNEDGRYRFIASGSQLGVALAETPSVPIGSIEVEQMYPLDFEEFLLAMGCGEDILATMREHFDNHTSLSESLHNYIMQQFKMYLLIGGMPEAINAYIESKNITKVRRIQKNIRNLYRIDASQYDSTHKLLIRRIYDMIPSNLENKKKRIIVKNIESTKGHKQFSDYADEWEYLTESGIALAVTAISNPRFPLNESVQKNLFKLYLNDVGILTEFLYQTNINAILQDERSINLGTVYESVVAQELRAHGFDLHYYDNKKHGEVDFLIDDFASLQVLPLEIKSGKDYSIHSALNTFLGTPDYNIHHAIVFNNQREITRKGEILYMPIYYCMFLRPTPNEEQIILPIPSAPTLSKPTMSLKSHRNKSK